MVEESSTDEYVYYDVGSYIITLTVTDDKGATGIAQLTVEVSSMEAENIRILPRTLNLESKGRWMHAWVELPQECDATQVGVNTIEVIEKESSQMLILITANVA